LANATSPAKAVEQARRLGERQLAYRKAEYVVVKKGQRGVSLFQAIESILLGMGDVFEEPADITQRQLAGMASVVKENEAARPSSVAFSRPGLAKPSQRDLTDEIEETRGRG